MGARAFWTRAENLRVGDFLISMSGRDMMEQVTSITIIGWDKYNEAHFMDVNFNEKQSVSVVGCERVRIEREYTS